MQAENQQPAPNPVNQANLTTRRIYNSKGDTLCDFIQAMTTRCVHCGHELTEADGCFFVLTNPYCGVIHRKCAPWFSFNGEWPHANPVAYYFEKGKQFGSLNS